MIETLYKTKTPEAFAWTEQHFELTLGEKKVDGRLGYFVRETQCWWDPAGKRTVRVQYTLSPREGFATIEEAQGRYDSQKTFRARRGFVHCFAPRYEATKRSKYVRIEVPAEPRNHETPITDSSENLSQPELMPEDPRAGRLAPAKP
jgi:hypothetical protein